MIRYFRIALFLIAFALVARSQSPEREDLRFLIIEALSHNPDIAADLAKMDAAGARISQAGSLDDPELRVMQKEMPGFEFSRAMATSVEFMQMVRFPTKLSLQSDIAAVRAEHSHHEHLENVLAVIRQLKTSFAELWYARVSLSINREDQDLLQQIVKVAQTQYAVGKVPQSDVLKVQIELAKVRAEEARLRQKETSAASMLRALLNRESSTSVGVIELDSLVEVSIPVETLVSYALANRPMLVHDSLSVQESSLMTSLAKQEYLPDFTFAVEYMKFAEVPRSRWSVSAGISIPFAPWTLGKAASRVEEAQSELRQMDAAFQSTKNMVESGIHDSYARQKAAAVLVRTYTGELIPQTRQSLESTLAEYQTGRTSYLMLLDSYRVYQMVRRDSAMARMNYEMAVADLEFEAGVMDLSIVSAYSQENEP